MTKIWSQVNGISNSETSRGETPAFGGGAKASQVALTANPAIGESPVSGSAESESLENLNKNGERPPWSIGRRAFLAACLAPLALPFLPKLAPTVPAPVAAAQAPDLGISLRFVRSYDVAAHRLPARLDVLYGFGTLRPGFACRVEGSPFVDVEGA